MDVPAQSCLHCKHALSRRVNLIAGDLRVVHIGGMLPQGNIEGGMLHGHDCIEELSEDIIALSIPGAHANSLDHGVPLIINSGFDALCQANSECGL